MERYLKYMNESLLDNVEVDEVEDNDECNIISLKYKVEDEDYAKHFSKVASSILNKFDYVQEVIRVNYYNDYFVDIDFKIDDNVTFEHFCDLVARIVKPKELKRSYEFAFNLHVNSSVVDNCCLSANYDFIDFEMNIYNIKHQFYNFFKFYYPDVDDEYILKIFFHSFAVTTKEQKTLINIDDDTYYVDEQYNLTEYKEGYKIVKNQYGKYTYKYKDGKYLIQNNNERWFDECFCFCEGFAIVRTGNRCTFINTSGNFIIRDIDERWFNKCNNFKEGFAIVEEYSKGYTFIDNNGNFLIDDEDKRWFSKCLDFYEGIARVENKTTKKMTFIDTGGNYFIQDSDKRWFDYCWCFHEGFAIVENGEEEETFIDKNGDYLIDDEDERWFKNCMHFHEGFAVVENGEEETFIDKNGDYLIDDEDERWFKSCMDFDKGFAKVANKSNRWNFIDKNGNIVFDEWFDDMHKYTSAGNGFFVTDDGVHLNQTGEFVAVI